MENKKRLLLYVHFNRNNELSEHVIYQLQHLRPNFEEIFFISNSKLTDEDFAQLTAQKLTDGFMQRENVGYDFAAWSEAMKHYGFDKLASYDSVTIMNDTCFGPIYDFAPIFEQMDSDKQVDFWGITNNRSHKVKPWEDKDSIVLPDHIQSYFVSYKQNVVQSAAFEKFWSNIEILSDVVAVIINYETAMTQHFEDAGFKSAVLFDTRKEDWTGMVLHDFSVFNLPELLKRKIPFLKIKAFSYGAEYPTTPLVIEQIKADTTYPVSLIINHMTAVDYPDREYMLAEKTLTFTHKAQNQSQLKIGIHLHANYPELIPEYLDYFDKYVKNYDLYITTDSQEKKVAIEQAHPVSQLKAVILTESEEILAWQAIAPTLKQYDLCGHFGTQKSEGKDWLVEEARQREIKQALLKPAQEIFQEFEKNPKLGLVVSEIQPVFNQPESSETESQKNNRQLIEQTWQEINSEIPRDLKTNASYMLTCGIMVWYKPQSLRNLLKININDKKNQNNLPYDDISKVFSYLLIYVSWINGYDFKIAGFSSEARTILARPEYTKVSSEAIDFTQIRTRKLVKLLIRKVKKILKYRFTGKE